MNIYYGVLGNGTTAESNVPVEVSGFGPTTAKNNLSLNKHENDEIFIKNCTYDTGEVAGKIKLTNGNFSDQNGESALLDKIVYGDLNNDNKEDVAVIIKSSGGGSGIFSILLAGIKNGDKFDFLKGIFLGDRIIIESIKIDKGIIILNMIVQGPNDGLCCPSVKTVQKYKIINNKLVPVQS
jgi:hypothetical protein